MQFRQHFEYVRAPLSSTQDTRPLNFGSNCEQHPQKTNLVHSQEMQSPTWEIGSGLVFVSYWKENKFSAQSYPVPCQSMQPHQKVPIASNGGGGWHTGKQDVSKKRYISCTSVYVCRAPMCKGERKTFYLFMEFSVFQNARLLKVPLCVFIHHLHYNYTCNI